MYCIFTVTVSDVSLVKVSEFKRRRQMGQLTDLDVAVSLMHEEAKKVMQVSFYIFSLKFLTKSLFVLSGKTRKLHINDHHND